MSNTNCNSIEVVYIIKCEKCQVFYIGESGRSAKIRFKEHLRNIKYFINNTDICLSNFDKQSEIAKHFCEKNHVILNDLKFMIIKKDLQTKERKSMETDLINLILNTKNTIINDKLTKINKITNLSFLNTSIK